MTAEEKAKFHSNERSKTMAKTNEIKKQLINIKSKKDTQTRRRNALLVMKDEEESRKSKHYDNEDKPEEMSALRK